MSHPDMTVSLGTEMTNPLCNIRSLNAPRRRAPQLGPPQTIGRGKRLAGRRRWTPILAPPPWTTWKKS